MGSTAELRAFVMYYVSGLLARRWTILLVAWAICVVGWFGIAMLSNVYTANARIYVDTQSLLGPLMRGLTVQPDVQQQVDIMRRTLLTRPNVEEIVRRADLDLSISSPADLEKLVERLRNDIDVEVDGPNLFTIEYSALTARRAQRVVDTTLQIFVDMNLGDAQEDMESARRFIDQQISEYETKLRNAELKVADYRRTHADQLGNTEQLQHKLEQARQNTRQYRSAMESARWQYDQLKLQMASVDQFLDIRSVTSGGGERARLSGQLDTYRTQLDSLLTQYTERHPDVVKMRNLIEQTEGRMRSAPAPKYSEEKTVNPTWEQLNQEAQRVELGIGALQKRIEEEERQIEILIQRMAQTPEAHAELIHMNRDYEVLLKQYQNLIERRESARIAQRMGTEAENVEFRIIEPPIEPVQPSGPPRVLLMTAVLIMAFGAGGAVALARLLMSDAFTSARQLSDTMGLPVIGTLSEAGTVFAGPSRILEAVFAAGTVLSLVGLFSGLVYLYVTNPSPTGFRTTIINIAVDVLNRFGWLI